MVLSITEHVERKNIIHFEDVHFAEVYIFARNAISNKEEARVTLNEKGIETNDQSIEIVNTEKRAQSEKDIRYAVEKTKTHNQTELQKEKVIQIEVDHGLIKIQRASEFQEEQFQLELNQLNER